jgi:MFS family permease
MIFGMLIVASGMALFAFKSPYGYPQFTVVAYVMSCSGVMILFVAATELLVRVLRTFDIDPIEHAEAVSAGVSLSFTAGLVGGSLFGGIMVQNLAFRGACRVLFYVMILLPFVIVVPFHPVFMHGKKLARSSAALGKRTMGPGEGHEQP